MPFTSTAEPRSTKLEFKGYICGCGIKKVRKDIPQGYKRNICYACRQDYREVTALDEFLALADSCKNTQLSHIEISVQLIREVADAIREGGSQGEG